MKKKITSLFLATILAVTSAVPVFAADAKSEFQKAFKKTSEVLQLEENIMNQSKFTDISNNLIKGPYKSTMDYKINEIKYPDYTYEVITDENGEETYETKKEEKSIKNIFFTANVIMDMKNNAYLVNSEISLPAALVEKKDDMKIKYDFYSKDSIVGVGLPGILDKFYYIDTNTFEEEWNKSELGKEYPVTKEQILMLKGMMPNMSQYMELASNSEKYDALNKKFEDVFTSTIERGVYQSHGADVVPAARGAIDVQKYSVVIGPEVIKSTLNDMAKIMKDDKDFREIMKMSLSSSYYSLYTISPEIGTLDNFTDESIKTVVEGLNAFEVKNNFVYTIFVNADGLVVRNELRFVIDDGYGRNYIKAVVDTKGTKYLYDEMSIQGSVKDSNGNIFGATLDLVGNIVPNNGHTKFDYSVNLVDGELGDTNATYSNLVNGKFSFNENKETNNFFFDVNLGEELKSLFDFYFVVSGDVSGDSLKNTMKMNLKEMKMTSDTFSLDMSLDMTMAPATETIAMPSNSEKITALTKVEIERLTETLSAFFN